MEKTRQAPQTGNRLLMAGRLSSEHQDILQELWNLKPVMFNGTLEWLYSFIQLNWQHRTQDSTHESTSENVNWIKLAEHGHSKNHEYLNLLITAAFDAKSQADLCIAAAIQVGEVLRDLPFHINTTIFPYVTCDEIPAILGGNQFTVWLHISHGKRGSGLFEGRTENHAHLKRWEASIPARGGGLQLVILSACESDDIARALVMRGVRVAIGYEADVLSEAAKQLARRVIREALQWGDRQEAILRAFNEVCEDLHRFTAIRNGEIRRYVDSLPRAFVLDERAS